MRPSPITDKDELAEHDRVGAAVDELARHTMENGRTACSIHDHAPCTPSKGKGAPEKNAG